MTSSTRAIETVDERVAEILRKKTPAERLAAADKLWQFAREMIRVMIVREHPEWTAEAIQRHVARRMSHGAV